MNSNISNPVNSASYKIVDHQQQGLILGTFEHPENWQVESNVYWNYQFTCVPSVFYARVENPEKLEIMEFLPMEIFSWTNPDMGMAGRGQNVNGVVNLPPMSGVDALLQLIIPKYRGNRQGLRIVETNAEPVVVQPPAAANIQNAFRHQVTVKIEYTENGQLLKEEFRCLHTVTQFKPVLDGYGAMYFTSWSVTDLCSFRAVSSEFGNVRQTFLKIQSSFQLNPQWMQLNNQIIQQLLQSSQQMIDQSIQNGWDMLRMNGQRIQETTRINNDYINRQQERINNSYNTPPPSMHSNSSKESEYGSHNAFIDAMREEQSFYNPENTANEKVSNYDDYIWKDQFGNVRTTNDPNFDPNAGSNGNWTQARKKRIGD